MVHSLLKQVFRGQADTTLRGLREGLRDRTKDDNPLKQTSFDFNVYQQTKLSSGKRLTIDADDVEEFLEHKKGGFCFLLLTMLYPDLKVDQISFHQDHMHPHSGFNTTALKAMGLDEQTIEHWQHLRDQLPNLQLLEGQENTQKQATPLCTWLANNATDPQYYRERNYIDEHQSLKLEDFEVFFQVRKQLLRNKLYQIFNVALAKESTEVAEA